MRNSREEPELSAFQAVGEIGYRQQKDEDSFKATGSMNSQAAAPQSMPHRGILKFYNTDMAKQGTGPTNKVVEINTSN